MRGSFDHWSSRLPFYYGWLIVGIGFVTMGVGVTARTAFSLLMPPLIDEFGWQRGLAAGAFSFGFTISLALEGQPVLYGTRFTRGECGVASLTFMGDALTAFIWLPEAVNSLGVSCIPVAERHP
jgi:hypothetical protein